MLEARPLEGATNVCQATTTRKERRTKMSRHKAKPQRLPQAMPANVTPAGAPPQAQQPAAATAPPPLFPVTDRNEVIPLIERIEDLRGSRLIAYFLQPGVNVAMDAMPCFYDQLRRIGKQPKIDLWVHSSGGQTEFPWRLVPTIRHFCDEFGVLVPEMATSAATHIALGANEIVGGPFTLLSPVDPSRRHPLLPKGIDLTDPTAPETPFPVSVQDLKHAVAFVKREAGEGGLTGQPLAQVLCALFDKVHPLAIGAIEQSYELSKLISRRMLSTHMDPVTEADEIERLTHALCDDFKSHHFPIGITEAQDMGLKITDAEPDLHDAMWALLDYYRETIDRSLQSVAPAAAAAHLAGVRIGGTPTFNSIGQIDSTAVRYDCNQIVDVGATGPQTRGSGWTKLETPTAGGGAGP
jgi:hypothetical protein